MRILETLRSRDERGIAGFWLSIVANSVGIPGLGSWLLGRRIGLVQMAISIGGVLLMGIWLYGVAARLIESEFIDAGLSIGARWLFAGIGLNAFSWLWALGTSLSVWQSKKAGVPPIQPGPEPPA